MKYQHVKDYWLFYVYGLTVLFVISFILISDILSAGETKVNWFLTFTVIIIMGIIVFLVDKFWNKK